MTLRAARSSLGGILAPQTVDQPIFLGCTMAGGTALLRPELTGFALGTGDTSEYVAVRAEEILEYERTIVDLQRELLHYRRLLARHLQETEMAQEYSEPVVPLDAASVRVVDSILAARASASATFTDFEEGEL